jgi:hypothetical protein
MAERTPIDIICNCLMIKYRSNIKLHLGPIESEWPVHRMSPEPGAPLHLEDGANLLEYAVRAGEGDVKTLCQLVYKIIHAIYFTNSRDIHFACSIKRADRDVWVANFVFICK